MVPVSQNEICMIDLDGTKLMAEVIRISGNIAYAQVFESTRRLRVGCPVEFTGHMLEVTLGPGMLSKKYDGLQNDLDAMTGVFLTRGDYTPALDESGQWHFTPAGQARRHGQGRRLARQRDGSLDRSQNHGAL